MGGRETNALRAAFAVSNIVIIPFKPRSFDIWTLADMTRIISEMRPTNPKLKVYSVINQADSRGIDNDESLKILQECEEMECLDITIGARKVFGNAVSEGLGITEMKNKDLKATEEIHALYDFIYN